MAKYAIGLDFGSLSVRALMIDIVSGAEVAQSVFEYPHRIMDHHLPSGERLPGTFALQDPQDYLEGMMDTIQNVVRISGAMPEEVGFRCLSRPSSALGAKAFALCLLSLDRLYYY